MKIHTVQLHLGDLLGGTQDMDNREYGAYVALFLSCYQAKENFLPIDDKKLARIAKCSPQEWRVVKHAVLEKFKISDGYLTHSRVEIDVATYKKKSDVNRSNALKRNNSIKPVASHSHSETPAILNPRPKTHNPISITTPVGVSEIVWKDFVAHRKAKKSPVSATVVSGIGREAKKANISLQEALETIVARGWQGFKAEWLTGGSNGKQLTGHAALAEIGKEARRIIDQERGQGEFPQGDTIARTGLLVDYDPRN